MQTLEHTLELARRMDPRTENLSESVEQEPLDPHHTTMLSFSPLFETAYELCCRCASKFRPS